MAKHRPAQVKLQKALICLLEKEGFDRLSVSSICKKAMVHRSTFYAYYNNQSELLEDTYHYMTSLFLSEFQTYQDDLNLAKKDSYISEYYLKPYLTFVKDHQKIYCIYISHPENFKHTERFNAVVEHYYRHRYLDHGITNHETIAYMTSFFMAGMTQIIRKWLQNGCAESIDTMVKIIQSCLPKLN